MAKLARVHAMVLCDDVMESEQEPDVFHLTGVRTAIESTSFPTVYSLCVFAQMSGHRGDAQCYVELEHAESGDVIGETELLLVSFDDPTMVVPLLFRIANCVFPTPGLYYVQIYCESKLIGERRFDVLLEE